MYLLRFVYDFNLGLCCDRSVGVAGGGVVVGQLSVGRADNLREENHSEHREARAGHVLWRESSSSEATTRVTKALSGQEWVSTMLCLSLSEERERVGGRVCGARRPTNSPALIHAYRLASGCPEYLTTALEHQTMQHPWLHPGIISTVKSAKATNKKVRTKTKQRRGLRGRRKTKALLSVLLLATGYFLGKAFRAAH